MSNLKIQADWIQSDEKEIVLAKTAANLLVEVNGCSLTRNINIWDHKASDSVIVSTYPLAEWFAYYWWRLENELMPIHRNLSFDWKCAHEIASANNGFVWPQIMFASDGEFINVYSRTFSMPEQSVEYIGKFDNPQMIPLTDFQKEVSRFIEVTLDRLGDLDSNLLELWNTTVEEMKSPESKKIRQMEASLGFDPEECPESLLNLAFSLQSNMGENSIREIAPLLKENEDIQKQLSDSNGIEISIDISKDEFETEVGTLPWQKGVNAARKLREMCFLSDKPIKNSTLRELLCLSQKAFGNYETFNKNLPISVGRNQGKDKWNLIPKHRKSPTGIRFELSRILGDAIIDPLSNEEWLVVSGYNSARQKSQRAFAAEFLCPIDSLDAFLDGDYSEENQEEAARYYNVSLQTINSLLVNNRLIGRDQLLQYE